MVPTYSSSNSSVRRRLGSISTTYRRRLATNSSRSPTMDTFISEVSCDLQPWKSSEEPYGLVQQRERSAKTCQKRMSVPSVAVSTSEECLGREQAIFQPSPSVQPRLRQKQEQMTEFGDGFVRHELLENPVPYPFPEGRGRQAREDVMRNGCSGVPRHHEGEAMIDRNLEMASGGFV